jgi:acetylornithine/succinyldiaminopimelate/putrescine aminotransferase
MIVEGKGQYVFDEQGRRYLNALGGIVTISVGHCHPDVVEAARRQNELLLWPSSWRSNSLGRTQSSAGFLGHGRVKA